MWRTTTQNARDLWNSHRLRIGYSHNTMTNDERMQRESSLIATIRKNLPDFAKACADDTELVLLHQDAFAGDYQEDEYLLLGMAIKYAGLRGKEVRVIGKIRSTLGEEETKSIEHAEKSLKRTIPLVACISIRLQPVLFVRRRYAVGRCRERRLRALSLRLGGRAVGPSSTIGNIT